MTTGCLSEVWREESGLILGADMVLSRTTIRLNRMGKVERVILDSYIYYLKDNEPCCGKTIGDSVSGEFQG